MPNPYVIIATLVVWAGSLIGVGIWQNKAGHTAEQVTFQATQNKELADANAQILKLNDDARATEQKHADELAAVATRDEKEKSDEIAKKDSLIAQLRAGTLQLHDPGATSVQAGGSGSGQSAAGSGGSNGEPTGQLSEQLAEFLINEASRADKVVLQLQACQAVIQSDRESQ